MELVFITIKQKSAANFDRYHPIRLKKVDPDGITRFVVNTKVPKKLRQNPQSHAFPK